MSVYESCLVLRNHFGSKVFACRLPLSFRVFRVFSTMERFEDLARSAASSAGKPSPFDSLDDFNDVEPIVAKEPQKKSPKLSTSMFPVSLLTMSVRVCVDSAMEFRCKFGFT